MQKTLVDKFIVPEESKDEFLARSRKVQGFLKTLPGFVEGFLYERLEGDGHYNYMTTAVWENEEVFENAKKSVAEESKRLGFKPQETRTKLKIASERDLYQRYAY